MTAAAYLPWTVEQVATLRREAPQGAEHVAALVGRSAESVRQKASKEQVPLHSTDRCYPAREAIE